LRPRNVVRIVLQGAGRSRPTSAAHTYRGLLADGTLADSGPALLLEQGLRTRGRGAAALGLLARFRAEDPDRRVILPHEQTRKGPKEDRYRLLKATRANFSPIFMMFADVGGSFRSLALPVTETPPLLSYTDDADVGHRLWRVTDPGGRWFPEGLGAARNIADGHHRYATALRCDETGRGAGPSAFAIGTPACACSPYHRSHLRPSLMPRSALSGSRLCRRRRTPEAAARAAFGGAACLRLRRPRRRCRGTSCAFRMLPRTT
jgi:hypothetical protein